MRSHCQLINPYPGLRSRYATVRDIRNRVTWSSLSFILMFPISGMLDFHRIDDVGIAVRSTHEFYSFINCLYMSSRPFLHSRDLCHRKSLYNVIEFMTCINSVICIQSVNTLSYIHYEENCLFDCRSNFIRN